MTSPETTPDPVTPLLSRRLFLALTSAAAALTLTGCENTGNSAPRSAAQLPAPAPASPAISPSYDAHFAPPSPTHPLPPAPLAKAPANSTYGILPRSMWAKAGPNLATIQPMAGVKLITFHHSGDPKVFTTTDFAETAQHLEYVREYHRSKNFQDIGYHFAIDRAGRVWQLRSLKYEGQHVRYNNEHNLGVVVLGNFDLQAMSQAQKDKIKIFGSLLRKKYPVKVYTHQEIVSTECPGHGMQPYMVAIRKQKLI